MRSVRILGALLALGLAPLPVWAGTITVSPGQSIAAALRQARGGDTILVAPGTYPEHLGCDIPSGTAAQPTVLKSLVPGKAVIPVDGEAISLGGDCGEQRYIVIDGFTLTGDGRRSGQGITTREGASYITIQNNDIGNILGNGDCSNSLGLSLSTAHHLTIRGNVIHDMGATDPVVSGLACNYSYAIYMGGHDNVIEGNILRHISGYAIHGYHFGSHEVNNNVIRNNTICDTGPAVLLQGSGSVVTGNRLVNVGHAQYPYVHDAFQIDSGNTVGENPVMANDSACVGQPSGPPLRLPQPIHLRIVTQ